MEALISDKHRKGKQSLHCNIFVCTRGLDVHYNVPTSGRQFNIVRYDTIQGKPLTHHTKIHNIIEMYYFFCRRQNDNMSCRKLEFSNKKSVRDRLYLESFFFYKFRKFIINILKITIKLCNCVAFNIFSDQQSLYCNNNYN